MSKSDKNETSSPDIIKELIPGKNDNYNDKPVDQSSNNKQQPFIENYNEKEAAKAVIEATEESKKNVVESNTYKAENQIPLLAKDITDTMEQTAQSNKNISENSVQLQRQMMDSFQSAFLPNIQNVQNHLSNNQEFVKSMSEMYFRLVNNYTESAIALYRMWNDIAFTNVCIYKNAVSKAGASAFQP